MKYKLIVTWPKEVSTGCNEVDKNYTTDTYDSLEQAEAVSGMLYKQGFGGDGKFFPIDSKVKEVYSRSEIKINRQKMIDQLKDPKSEKTEGLLEDPNNNNARCCLGHGCHALNIERFVDSNGICYGQENDSAVAPPQLINKVGLFFNLGVFQSRKITTFKSVKFDSLVGANDGSNLTPQDIGEYLESVIEGGEDTPWKPLSEYPENL